MPVMKQLNLGGTTYDTVGEASVTRVVTSGTKIATITIDGTSSDLYAPSGSSVDPATASPLMDGTAAVGSSAKYAREDHVHPTDTSRVAVSATDDEGTSIIRNQGWAIVLQQKAPNNTTNSKIQLDSDGIITTFSGGDGPTVDASGIWLPSAPTNDRLAANKGYVDAQVATKQATLVSGTNIKTVNGNSLLGSGDLTVGGLPSVSASDNGKVLTVVNGAWAAASLPVYDGTVE